MILLKANPEIKTVFLKMIKTMGENVKWTETFVINNNDIILAGTGRSLFFNFDNKRAFSNIVELPIKEDNIEQIAQNPLLDNALNMILYAFGKWGEIKGLKVDTNYDQLNKLINNILTEIDIEARLTKDNFRFYKNGIQITYEEVIQAILDKSKPEVGSEEIAEEKDEEDDLEKDEEEEKRKYKMGLWHTMCWTAEHSSFIKEELSESDKVKKRIGNNFYMVNYKCPSCGEKLHMVIYPEGNEFRIETESEAVYMARAYTCNACYSFYTAKPHKLLVEGDIYNLLFEEDGEAYEDYLELLGKQGERTSNCNFNLYESEYNQKEQTVPPELKEICNEMSSMSEEAIVELKDKIDSGFYSLKSVEKYHKKVEKELKSRKNNKSKEQEKESKPKQEDKGDWEKADNGQQGSINKEMQKQEGTKRNLSKKDFNAKEFDGLKDIVGSLLRGDFDFFAKAVEKLSFKQMGDLKLLIQSEKRLEENQKKSHLEKIEKMQYKEKSKELIQKAVSCKGKNHTQILRIIDEIRSEDCADSVKNPIINSLMELLKKSGESELDYIVSTIPENISRKQYKQFIEKIQQYKEVNNTPHKELLEEKRDIVEKQEIATFIKRANAADRKSLFELHQKLKDQDFEEKNVKPFLEKIHDKIYGMDEAAIKKICPEPADITFEEGLQLHEEIASGNFLPELKVNILGLIDKRLIKLKMDESEQLVKKLRKDTEQIVEENPRVYYNEVRKRMRGDVDKEEFSSVNNALDTYVVSSRKYEYPLLICDSSFSANGVKGFVLTPDHIFYNGWINSGVIEVKDIEKIAVQTGVMGRGIYVKSRNNGIVKISNSLKLNKLEPFAAALNDFVGYLKEKPESRSIAYLAKEKHVVKCCYRCGYVYKGGNVCPKCGSKSNDQ